MYAEDKLTLYRYRPLAPSAARQRPAAPVLIVYALVNRPYMMDLQPDRSLIRRLLELGLDVYLIDWGYSRRRRSLHRSRRLHQRLHRSLRRQVLRAHGIPSLNLLGVCQGGTFSLCYTALHPERVRNLITMVTPVDFQTPRQPAVAVGARVWTSMRWSMRYGVVPGDLLNAAYVVADAVPAAAAEVRAICSMARGRRRRSENFMRMEKWIFDSPDQAGAAFGQFARWLFQENRLVTGTLEIGGRRVDLRRITQPVLNIYGQQDHLVPPSASTPLERLVGSQRLHRRSALDVGHIGMYVSARAQREVAGSIASWLCARADLSAS